MAKKIFTDEELKKRYTKIIRDKKTIVNRLNHNRYYEVAHQVGWGISYWDLVDLCIGYKFGTEKLKENITDFLEDINYHYECGQLLKNPEEFIAEALDEDSDYVKKFW